MVGTLTLEQIDALLAEQRFARLGCHANGKTYVVPISYALDGDRLLGQTTFGLKIEMMRLNPEVCIEVDDVRSLTDWRSAIVWGRFRELEGIEAATAMGKLIDRYGPLFEDANAEARLGRNITPDRVDHRPANEIVYEVKITEMTGRFERADA